ncbi:hypothetical protein GGR57DRAFT_519800, partial [Xylariaceae sp. FL1272]
VELQRHFLRPFNSSIGSTLLRGPRLPYPGTFVGPHINQGILRLLRVPSRPLSQPDVPSITAKTYFQRRLYTVRDEGARRGNGQQGNTVTSPLGDHHRVLLILAGIILMQYRAIIEWFLFERVHLSDEDVSEESPEAIFAEARTRPLRGGTNASTEALKRKMKDEGIHTFCDDRCAWKLRCDPLRWPILHCVFNKWLSRPRLARSTLVKGTRLFYETQDTDTGTPAITRLWFAVDSDIPYSFSQFISDPHSEASSTIHSVMQQLCGLPGCIKLQKSSSSSIPVFLAFRESFIGGEYKDWHWRYMEYGRWISPTTSEQISSEWIKIEK